MIPSLWCSIDSQCYIFYIRSFIVAHFTATSSELMSGAKSREWVHQKSTNQPTNQGLGWSVMSVCYFM